MAQKSAQMDLSSFMCIILMLVGVLMILLISNVLTIISNPENVQISAVVKGALYAEQGEVSEEDKSLLLIPKFRNRSKEPTYVDVYSDKVVIYPEGEIVPVVALERAGNAFERLLNSVELQRDRRYIVLLARPRSAYVIRRLQKAIADRGVDMGFEPFEEGRAVEIASSGTTIRDQSAEQPPEAEAPETPEGAETPAQ